MARKRAKAADSNAPNGSAVGDRIEYVSLSNETRRRYLNYAMSVIMSRALPDVRDGLKPVQRRILYVMYQDLRLTADAKTRKCAKICGDTTGNYHPHGDMAVYEALVRLAQDFSLRFPLVEGQGNFGSIMGLKAAAARYTEARLTPIAAELMNELRFQTVDYRPNYDATRNEPIVLPARFPNLLVNGTQGIAVGMATNIPPHNLREVVRACTFLIESPDATVAQLMKYVKGPDFPLGGRIVSDRTELRQAYEEGRGSIKVRGEWDLELTTRRDEPLRIVIKSVPYGVSTGPLLAEIGNIVASRKVPQLLEVSDETDEKHGLRLVLEAKPGTDPEIIMSYLYRHTSLEQNFAFNMTCLVPDEQGATIPAVVNLKEMLQHFLDFRFQTVRRRFEYQLRQLEKRIHILEGFEIIFNDLDRALKMIRTSDGKQDAAQKLMTNYSLDEVQTDAILELALYRISKLEIDRIQKELEEKRAEAEKIRRILASDAKLWKVVKDELDELGERFAERRRTSLGSSEEIGEFDPQAYIVRENTNVVITNDGWLKRVGRLARVESTRVREGDTVLDVLPASTLDHVMLFANDGVAYTLPVEQIPASSGYGEPLSKHVKIADGARILRAITGDARFTPEDHDTGEESGPAPFLLIATTQGQIMRLPLSGFRTASTKVGRKYCRLRSGDSVAFVELQTDAQTMFLATRKARILHFSIDEVPVLANPGKGVRGMRLETGDEVIGGVQLSRPSDCLRVVNSNGTPLSFGQMKYGVTSRGGKGVKTSARNDFAEIVRPPIELVDWQTLED